MPKYQNEEQNRRLEKMEKHIEVLNSEMGEIKVDISEIKTDVAWIKKSYWIIFTASVSGLIASVFNLIIK